MRDRRKLYGRDMEPDHTPMLLFIIFIMGLCLLGSGGYAWRVRGELDHAKKELTATVEQCGQAWLTTTIQTGVVVHDDGSVSLK